MKIILVFMLFQLTFIASADEPPEWIYLLHSDRILVGNAVAGTIDRTISLSRTGAMRLHPTPGGKYVFVSFQNSRDVAVVDAETHEEMSIVSFDFEPAHIQFSPMGETAYITEQRATEIRIYDHRKARFTYTSSISKGRAGAPVLLNRRGTRLYRASDDGVIFIYLKTGEIIDEVRAAGFPDGFAISPDFRALWGVSERDGKLIIIDEPRGRISRRIDLDGTSATPIFAGPRGVVLQNGKLAVLQARSARMQENINLQNVSRGFVISQSGRIWSVFDAGVELLWLEGEVERNVIELNAPVVDLANVVVRSGEGFACF